MVVEGGEEMIAEGSRYVVSPDRAGYNQLHPAGCLEMTTM